jgi:hypothetical protein
MIVIVKHIPDDRGVGVLVSTTGGRACAAFPGRVLEWYNVSELMVTAVADSLKAWGPDSGVLYRPPPGQETDKA